MLKIIDDRRSWEEATSRILNGSIRCSYDYVDAAAALEEGGQAQLAVYENKKGLILHPYICRPVLWHKEVYDLISPYEFGGFWFSVIDDDLKHSLMNAFFHSFVERCHERSICCEFIRFSPFDQYRSNEVYDEKMAGYHAFATLNDIEGSSQLLNSLDSRLKWSIRKAERFGLTIKQDCDIDTFLGIYYENLKRIGAKPFYYFPRYFFEKIAPHLTIFHAYKDGEVYASHTYLKDERTIFAFLCHGVWAKRSARANDYLYYHAMCYEWGGMYERFHLGGGNDRLLRYKKKFGKLMLPAFIGTSVFNGTLYEELVKKSREQGATCSDRAYFPLYRMV